MIFFLTMRSLSTAVCLSLVVVAWLLSPEATAAAEALVVSRASSSSTARTRML